MTLGDNVASWLDVCVRLADKVPLGELACDAVDDCVRVIDCVTVGVPDVLGDKERENDCVGDCEGELDCVEVANCDKVRVPVAELDCVVLLVTVTLWSCDGVNDGLRDMDPDPD